MIFSLPICAVTFDCRLPLVLVLECKLPRLSQGSVDPEHHFSEPQNVKQCSKICVLLKSLILKTMETSSGVARVPKLGGTSIGVILPSTLDRQGFVHTFTYSLQSCCLHPQTIFERLCASPRAGPSQIRGWEPSPCGYINGNITIYLSSFFL